MKDKKLYRSEQTMKDKNPFKNELLMALNTYDTNEIIDRLKSVLAQLAPNERNVFIVPVLITQICDNEGCVIVNGNSQIGDGNIQNNAGRAL
jgi:hypothetical protein|nr:MAG TPA: hypothetical protein [Caudoviricetes sp.]